MKGTTILKDETHNKPLVQIDMDIREVRDRKDIYGACWVAVL